MTQPGEGGRRLALHAVGLSALERLSYREIWLCDFEFRAADGERPDPHCMVARELRTGRRITLWADELRACRAPPFDIGPGSLFVAYYASAELGCFLALGWPMPACVLDLFAEFRVLTNGLQVPCGRSLLGALICHGLDSMGTEEKDEMRALAIRGGPFTTGERRNLIQYCAADVDALARLLPAMLPELLDRKPDSHRALGHALLRGRYMAAAARMERTGVPIDTGTLARLRAAWPALRLALVAAVDSRFGVYEGTSFRVKRFEAYLAAQGIPWPRLASGALALDDDRTFRDMTKTHPELQPLRELRHTMGELRLEELAVGVDRRNRCLLSAFRSKTGRNQPSNARFVFGPATWIRFLIQPERGMALAYIDFSSQEMGIAAALSGDESLLEAYRTGDIYLAFAKQAGLVPPGATKASHKAERDLCKTVVLGTLYGMGPETLARRIGRPTCEARELLQLHRVVYRRFWQWSGDTVASADLNLGIGTVFGWRLHVGAESNPRSLMNFPMQANGAEMMRLTACSATERGIRVCAPVHDAFLIEAPEGEIRDAIEAMQDCMREASGIVLGGVLELGSEAEVVRWPDRYADPRGAVMWGTLARLLGQVEAGDSHRDTGVIGV